MGAKLPTMKPPFKKVIAAIILVLSLLAPSFAGPLEDADTAYRKDDYATALRLLRPLADQGHPIAQSLLGIMYLNGAGVAQDYAEAMKWYGLSANQGYAPAQTGLGLMYFNGQVPPGTTPRR
jgi:TPR repeat protein